MTTKNSVSQIKIKAQWIILIVGVLLFVAKVIAFLLTDSVSILSDALESTINVITGFITLKSIQYASKPRDADHPYGHGKIELLTASVEGILIIVAGIIIMIEAFSRLGNPPVLPKMDIGIMLIAITGIINFILGKYSIKVGKTTNSIALIAGGKHLISDTYTTIALVGGLIIYYYSGILWLDSFLAILFGGFILYTGYGVIRQTVQGLMDEADQKKLLELSEVLAENKKDNWVNIHKLTYLKFGHIAHIDLHFALPWYYNLAQTEQEVDALKVIIKNRLTEDDVDISVQSEPCKENMCHQCRLDCPERKHPFSKNIEWTQLYITGKNYFNENP